jgi:hypothetical protein
VNLKTLHFRDLTESEFHFKIAMSYKRRVTVNLEVQLDRELRGKSGWEGLNAMWALQRHFREFKK